MFLVELCATYFVLKSFHSPFESSSQIAPTCGSSLPSRPTLISDPEMPSSRTTFSPKRKAVSSALRKSSRFSALVMPMEEPVLTGFTKMGKPARETRFSMMESIMASGSF